MTYSKFSTLNGKADVPFDLRSFEALPPGGPHHYDPSQPRVPAGGREGGRWTKFGALANPQTLLRPASAGEISPPSRLASLSDGTSAASRRADETQLALYPGRVSPVRQRPPLGPLPDRIPILP